MGTLRVRDDIGERLLKLKKQLEEEKSRRSELQGEYKSIMKQLKEDFKVNSIKQAEEKIEAEEKKLNEIEESIDEQIEEIENIMEEE